MKQKNKPTVIPLVHLQRQSQKLLPVVLPKLKKQIAGAGFILGSAVVDFETAFAQWAGGSYATGVANGTDALRLALQAVGLTAGDEVLLPVNTFIATASAVVQLGATPVFVDCDPETALLDSDCLAASIRKKTRAVIPVHLYGQMVDMPRLRRIVRGKKILIVEDAAQAHGALFRGKSPGDGTRAASYSFYPGKNLGAWGDAGGVVTNSKRVDQRIKMLRNYGCLRRYYHEESGWNSRLDPVQAIVLSEKLTELDRENNRRRDFAEKYRMALTGVGDLRFIDVHPDAVPVYHLFVIRTKYRGALVKYLNDNGVQALIHYPVPLHLQPAFRDLTYRRGDFPNAEKLAATILSLPLSGSHTQREINTVIRVVKDFFVGCGTRR